MEHLIVLCINFLYLLIGDLSIFIMIVAIENFLNSQETRKQSIKRLMISSIVSGLVGGGLFYFYNPMTFVSGIILGGLIPIGIMILAISEILTCNKELKYKSNDYKKKIKILRKRYIWIIISIFFTVLNILELLYFLMEPDKLYMPMFISLYVIIMVIGFLVFPIMLTKIRNLITYRRSKKLFIDTNTQMDIDIKLRKRMIVEVIIMYLWLYVTTIIFAIILAKFGTNAFM